MKQVHITAIMIVVGFCLSAQATTVFATNHDDALTPYQSGYQHGLNDPELKDIETPGKGFTSHGCISSITYSHTQTFNRGYVDGWCSKYATPGQSDGSDSDKGKFNCDHDTTTAKNIERAREVNATVPPTTPPNLDTRAKCIAAGYDWDAIGSCQTGIVGTFGPSHCYNDPKTGYVCEAGAGTIGNQSKGNATGNMTEPPTHEQLTYNTNHSPVWNAGYSEGFFGKPLHGTHTTDFFYGYMNGTKSRWMDMGYADGLSNLDMYTHMRPSNNDVWGAYEHGYNWAKHDTNETVNGNGQTLSPSDVAPLPKHTDDNNTNYYVGMDNGSFAAGKIERPDPLGDFGTKCPAGHGTEYCTGYKAGWNSVSAFETLS